MALISCPECRQSVSDMAVACPRCGYPVAGAPKSDGGIGGWLVAPWIARTVAAVMFFIAMIVMFAKGRA